MTATADFLRARVRTVSDWPKPGVQFRDITPLFADAKTARILMDVFVERYVGVPLDRIAAIDARGFILGAVLAHELNVGFAPVRKKGKLPFETLAEDYALEYGNATVEMHRDACNPGERVLIIDDLVATGGTMLAAAKLVQRLGGQIVECAAIIDLPDLKGSARLRGEGLELFHILSFAGD